MIVVTMVTHRATDLFVNGRFEVTVSTPTQVSHNSLGCHSSRSRSVTGPHIVISSNNYRSSDIRVIISTYRTEKMSDDHPYI
jgi:hypothetical protein